MTPELKLVLNQIVNDLEKTTVALVALKSGGSDQRTAQELAFQLNKDFYKSLRKQIDALK